MKIFLLICLFIICILVFLKLSDKILDKAKIFESILTFNNELLCDITLFRNGVIEKLSNTNYILQKTFLGAKDSFLRGENFVCKDFRLKSNERALISEYVNSLGRSDEDNQRKILDYFGEKFNDIYTKYKTDYEKRSKLYLRLGILSGTLLIILLV